jgi:Ankyrin repeats (3 copies)
MVLSPVLSLSLCVSFFVFFSLAFSLSLSHRQHSTDCYKQSPLHLSCVEGLTQSVDELLKAGALVNSQDNYGWTSLHEAASTFDFALCRRLLSEPGIDVNVPNGNGNVPLAFLLRVKRGKGLCHWSMSLLWECVQHALCVFLCDLLPPYLLLTHVGIYDDCVCVCLCAVLCVCVCVCVFSCSSTFVFFSSSMSCSSGSDHARTLESLP